MAYGSGEGEIDSGCAAGGGDPAAAQHPAAVIKHTGLARRDAFLGRLEGDGRAFPVPEKAAKGGRDALTQSSQLAASGREFHLRRSALTS